MFILPAFYFEKKNMKWISSMHEINTNLYIIISLWIHKPGNIFTHAQYFYSAREVDHGVEFYNKIKIMTIIQATTLQNVQ